MHSFFTSHKRKLRLLRLFWCYLVILSVELCLGKLWEFSSSHAQNYFNYSENTRLLGIPIEPRELPIPKDMVWSNLTKEEKWFR